jgi:hypothetical protein
VSAVLLLATAFLQPACSRGRAQATEDSAPESIAGALDPVRLERLVARNLDAPVSFPESLIAANIEAWRELPIGERIARWAGLYLRRNETSYVFGLKKGGYVADSLLVQDYRQDCVLFSYRCSELARASSPRDAVLRALDTRFAGGQAAKVVTSTGAVDYDDPSHLDFSLDIVRSGIWGRDVTTEIGAAAADSAGTQRYPAGSFAYIPTEDLRLDRFEDGDLLYFVFDENSARGQKMRDLYGLVIGHQGVARRSVDGVDVIHAAISDLPGEYSGNRVVRVPLRTYLRRVESFKGVIVTRLDEPGRSPRP